MKSKSGIFLSTMFLAIIAGAIYGALHDQISYTLSPEYFTHFKFFQFGLPWAFETPRLGAAWVGVLATWWMGVLLWLPLALLGLFFKSPEKMKSTLLKSFAIVILVTAIIGLSGLLYGLTTVTMETVTSGFPILIQKQIPNPVAFVQVGYLHNASYLGGAIGLIIASAYTGIQLYFSKKRANQ